MVRFSATVTLQYDTPFSPFGATEFDEALLWLEKSGFDAAEICICNYDRVDVASLKNKLDEHGLICSTISTGQARGLEGISLLDTDTAKQKAAQKRISEHIEAATILGSYVTIGLIRGTCAPEQKESSESLLIERLKPCVDYAGEKNVCLIIEPINRYETGIINNTLEAASFIERMGNPDSLGILWDTFHANIEDGDFGECIKTMGKKHKYLHIADSNRAFPGNGHFDFSALFEKLNEAGYDGYISFECFNHPSAEHVKKHAAEFIATRYP